METTAQTQTAPTSPDPRASAWAARQVERARDRAFSLWGGLSALEDAYAKYGLDAEAVTAAEEKVNAGLAELHRELERLGQ